MEKNNSEITKIANLTYEFENLSKEDQQQFVKTIIWKTIAHEYIERNTEIIANITIKGNHLTEEEVEKYRAKLVNEINEALCSLINTMFSDDEELKYRVFCKFINDYSYVEKKIRKDICGFNHSFTNWEKTVGKVPIYDEDGEIERYSNKKEYLKRICKYCGKEQKAYDEEHKEYIEQETKYYDNYFKKELQFEKPKGLVKNNKDEQL